MLKSNSRRRITLAITIFCSILLLIYSGLRVWIKSDIDQLCVNAMSKFEGDKIEALIAVLESDSQTLDEKNRAIWALGKLQDKRALHSLKSLYAGEVCDHTRMVCQQELERAIRTLEGESIDILKFK